MSATPEPSRYSIYSERSRSPKKTALYVLGGLGMIGLNVVGVVLSQPTEHLSRDETAVVQAKVDRYVDTTLSGECRELAQPTLAQGDFLDDPMRQSLKAACGSMRFDIAEKTVEELRAPIDNPIIWTRWILGGLGLVDAGIIYLGYTQKTKLSASEDLR